MRGEKSYIENKYWNHYIGETDDSLTLVEYLARKQKEKYLLERYLPTLGWTSWMVISDSRRFP